MNFLIKLKRKIISSLRRYFRIKPAKPNFLCVGFGKSGTTSLHYMLREHPDVCLPGSKEAHYFDNDADYGQGVELYLSKHFPHYSGEKIVGDITPAYITQRKYLERIAETLGTDIKIIVLVRNPITRAFSHYIHAARLMDDNMPFLDSQGMVGGLYSDCSSYDEMLSALFSIFPRENIKIYIFERETKSRGMEELYKDVLGFLGIKYVELKKYVKHANVGYLPKITVISDKANVEVDGVNHELEPGDVIVEHFKRPEGYAVDIKRNLNAEEVRYYRDYQKNITRKLTKDAYNSAMKEFEGSIRYVRDLLGDPIPEWDIENLKLPSYSDVDSRLIINKN